MAGLNRGTNQNGAGIAQRRCAGVGAQGQSLTAVEPFDELRDAPTLVERGQRKDRLVHAVRTEQHLGASRVLGDDRVAFAEHAQGTQRNVLEVADRRGDDREGSRGAVHLPQSRG